MQNRTKKFDNEDFISGENRWRYLFDQLQTLTSMFWLECPDIKSNFFFFFWRRLLWTERPMLTNGFFIFH